MPVLLVRLTTKFAIPPSRTEASSIVNEDVPARNCHVGAVVLVDGRVGARDRRERARAEVAIRRRVPVADDRVGLAGGRRVAQHRRDVQRARELDVGADAQGAAGGREPDPQRAARGLDVVAAGGFAVVVPGEVEVRGATGRRGDDTAGVGHRPRVHAAAAGHRAAREHEARVGGVGVVAHGEHLAGGHGRRPAVLRERGHREVVVDLQRTVLDERRRVLVARVRCVGRGGDLRRRRRRRRRRGSCRC